MTFGSLFAGIGGFDLGFERAGLDCRWQVEIDDYCRRVLAKHWPDVPRHDDIKTFPPPGDWAVDIICGGFPCQDISNAGKRAGINGERSGLWSEMLRVVRVVRPQYVVVENVAALLGRGMDRVLGDLAESGFDAEWNVLAASDFGAPHIRERVFIVAYANGSRCGARTTKRCAGEETREPVLATGSDDGADSKCIRRDAWSGVEQDSWRENHGDESHHGVEISDAQYGRREGRDKERNWSEAIVPSGWWSTEPGVGRLAHGIPNRVHRLRGLGNAVVPQIAEWIGRRIIESQTHPNAG